MAENRKPGWAFCTTITLIVAVLYLFSCGPMIWLATKLSIAPRGATAMVLRTAYQPFFAIIEPSQRRCSWILSLDHILADGF